MLLEFCKELKKADDSGLDKTHLIAVGATAAMAAVAWALIALFKWDAWFNTLFLLIFATGVQTFFFEMLPIRNLYGRGVFEYHRGIWLVLFSLSALVFIQTMLNPEGSFVSAFNTPNIVILAWGVAAFCIASAGLWFYLERLNHADSRLAEQGSKVNLS